MSHRERNAMVVILVVFALMLLSGVLLIALERKGNVGEYLVTSAVAFATGAGIGRVVSGGRSDS